jgi:hypothetical protein
MHLLHLEEHMAPGNLSTDDLARDPDRSSSEPVRQPAGDDRVRVVRVGDAAPAEAGTRADAGARADTGARTETDLRGDAAARADADQRTDSAQRTDEGADPRQQRDTDRQPAQGGQQGTSRGVGDGREPAAGASASGQRADDARDLALLDDRETQDFLGRWSDVQARFVDDPKAAVRDGDSLVAELMQALAQRFSQHKGQLEEQWNRGGEPDTEDLRLALQRYRSFFQRLLST